MLQIAIELRKTIPATSTWRSSSSSHFEWIAIAMNPPDGDTPLWDEEDGFYYDVMRMADGSAMPLKVRSLVGLLPLCAATVFERRYIERNPSAGALTPSASQNAPTPTGSGAPASAPSPEGRRIVVARR